MISVKVDALGSRSEHVHSFTITMRRQSDSNRSIAAKWNREGEQLGEIHLPLPMCIRNCIHTSYPSPTVVEHFLGEMGGQSVLWRYK